MQRGGKAMAKEQEKIFLSFEVESIDNTLWHDLQIGLATYFRK